MPSATRMLLGVVVLAEALVGANAPSMAQLPPETSLALSKTVYAGHDDGGGCEGADWLAADTGTPLTYCFVVTNSGETVLEDVTVDDPDLGVDQDDMALLSGDLATMAPGASAALSYGSTLTGDLLNTATAAACDDVVRPEGPPGGGGGFVAASDTAEVWAIVLGDLPDLTITKVPRLVGPAGPGDEVTWDIAVSNITAFDAAGLITVTDDLPDGLDFVSVDGGGGWSCTTTARRVVCELGGGLAGLAGLADAPVISLVTRIVDDTRWQITNHAEVATDDVERRTANNQADGQLDVNLPLGLGLVAAGLVLVRCGTTNSKP